MRYLIAGAIGVLVLVPSVGAASDSDCMGRCILAKMPITQCWALCPDVQTQGGSGNSPGGFIGGYMRGKEARAQQEQAAAQTRLLEEQTRAIQLENQRRAAELSQSSRPAEVPATGTASPSNPGAVANSDYRDWQAAIQTRKWRYPDFNDVVYSPGVEISGYMIQCMAHSPYAADIAYYLGKHKDEAERIGRMDFLDTAVAIKEIEGRVSSPDR